MIRWKFFKNIKDMTFTIEGTMIIHPDERDEDTLFKLVTDAMYLRDYYKRDNDVMLELVFEDLVND